MKTPSKFMGDVEVWYMQNCIKLKVISESKV